MINILMEVFGALTIRIDALNLSCKRRQVNQTVVMSLVVNLLEEILRSKNGLFCCPVSQERTVGNSASWYTHDVSMKASGVTRKS